MKGYMLLLVMGLAIPCAWADAPSLQNTINLIETKPAEAEKVLETLPQPTAKAFDAYLKFVRTGPSVAVDNLMNSAITGVKDTYALGDIDPNQSYHYQNLQEVLNHLRYIAGAEEDEQVDIPCFMFWRHPLEAYRAFGAYWGSNRDNFPAVCQNHPEALPKLKQLTDYTSKYRQFDRDLQGSSVYSKYRHQFMYLMKAYYTPEYSLAEVGLETDATTLAQARKAMPKARWLNGVKPRLDAATAELAGVLKKSHKDIPLGVLTRHTREALEAYVSYELIKGEIAKP